ncbi:hypothetical protein [Tateyamaria sp. SN6-1]|uniref:hypothetical protein n=1 Tax=Tateyamaria sp. SN6-1 TaxID=3092148 RepID=UPI0039F55AA4
MTNATTSMQVTFAPIRSHGRYVYEKQGDALCFDGEVFDFSALPDGAVLPSEAVASEAVCDDVRREGGALHVMLLLAHGADAPADLRFPGPVTSTEDGPITPQEARA